MARAFEQLEARLRLDASEFREGVDQATGDMDRLEKKSSQASQAIAGLGAAAGAAAVGGIKASIDAAASFESQMTESMAVVGDVSDEMRGKLETAAREVARTTTHSAEDAAESYYFLASAGLTAEEQLAAMPAVSSFASAGALEMGEATDYATDIMAAFGYEASELETVTDTLTATFTRHNQTASQMGTAMSYVAPVAASMGMEIENVSAALGMMGDAGIKGSRAGTALRQSLASLASPSAKQAELLEKLGVNATDSEGNLRDFTSIIRDLENAGISSGQVMELFGTQAGPGMQVLLNQGADALENNTSKIAAMGGITDEVAENQLQSFSAQLEIARSKIRDVGISVGQVLLPPLARILGVVNSAIEVFSRLNDRFDGLPVAIGLAATAIGGFAASAVALQGTALAALIPSLGAVAVAAGTVGTAVVAAGAVIGAAAAAWKSNFGGIRDYTVFHMERVSSAIRTTVADIRSVLEPQAARMKAIWSDLVFNLSLATRRFLALTNGVMNQVSNAWGMMGVDVVGTVNTLATSVVNRFEWFATAAGTAVRGGVERMITLWRSHGETVFEHVVWYTGRTLAAITGFFERVRGVLASGFGALQAYWSEHGQTVYEHAVWYTGRTLAAITGFLERVRGVLASGFSTLQAYWSEHGETVYGHVVGYTGRAVTAITTVLGRLKTILAAGVTALAILWSEHGQAVVTTVTEFVGRVITKFTEFVGRVREIWSQVAAPVTNAIDTIVAKGFELADRFGLISDSSDTLGQKLADLLPSILGLIVPVTRVLGVVDRLSQAWSENWMGIRTKTETAVEAIQLQLGRINQSIVQPGLESISGLFGTETGSWETAVSTAYTNITTLATEKMGEFDLLVSSALGDVTTAWQTHETDVATAMGTLTTSVREAFAVITTDVLPGFISLFTTTFGQFTGAIESLWSTHAGQLTGEFALLAETLLGHLNTLVAGFTRLWELFGDEILAIAEFAFSTIIGAFSWLADGLLTALATLSALFRGDWEAAWSYVAGFLQRTFDGLIGWVVEWGGRFIEWLAGLVGDAIRWFTDLATDVADTLIPDMFGDIYSAATGFGGDFIEWLSGFIESVVGFFTGLKETLVGNSVVPEMFSEIYDTATGFGGDLLEWLGGLVGDAVQWFTDLKDDSVDRVKTMTSDMYSDATSFGSDFVSWAGGLKDDVVGKFGDMKTEVKKKVSSMLKAAKKKAKEWVSDFTKPFKDAKENVLGKFEELKDELVGNSVVPDMLEDMTDEGDGWVGDFVSPFERTKRRVIDQFEEMRDNAGDIPPEPPSAGAAGLRSEMQRRYASSVLGAVDQATGYRQSSADNSGGTDSYEVVFDTDGSAEQRLLELILEEADVFVREQNERRSKRRPRPSRPGT